MSLAERLSATGAFKTGEFTLASGKKSSYYIDVKHATADPLLLRALAQHAAVFVPDHGAVAGTVLGGVPFATALSLETGRPLLMVRPEPKEHGTGKRVEGPVVPGARVLACEDVVTSGGSLVAAVEALRRAGCEVTHAVVVVDREEGARDRLKASGVTLHALITLSELKEEVGVEA